MPEQDPDFHLVQALQAGEETALNEIMKRYSEPLFRFIYRYFHHEQTAQEMTQETFVRCFFNIQQFNFKDRKAKFATWLYRIATNLCHDHARSRTYRKTQTTVSLFEKNAQEISLEQNLPHHEKTPIETILIKEKLLSLEKAIHELPHKLKIALIFTALENRSHAECAEILKTTPKTIEMRVYRARKLLQQKWNAPL